MFRTQNRGYSVNIHVALCMLPPKCVKWFIYSDVITSHVIIKQWPIADTYKQRKQNTMQANFGKKRLFL